MERQAKDGTIYQKIGQDEWAPVTRQAKDGTVFKKVGADEWAPQTPKQSAPEVPQQIEPGIGERVVRGALRTLPAIGAIGAGFLATPESMGLATIPAAAAGGIAGKSLEDTLENSIYGTGPKSYAEQAKGLALAGRDSAMAEMGGQAIGAVPGLVKQGIGATKSFVANKLGPNLDYTLIKNKDAVMKAAENLGVDLPKAVLTDNPTFQKLESGLSQSGSLPAKAVREQYNNLGKGLDAAAEKIAALKTPESDFAIGKGIQKDLTDQVEASRAPVKELYGKVTPDLQKIPVDNGVVNKVFGQLKKDPIFQTQDGAKFLAEHKQIISQTPELASLKEIRSGLKDLVNDQSLPIEQNRVSALQKAVTSIRNNSVEALKAELPKSAHPEVDDLMNEISLADAAHSTNVKDINSIKSIVGNKDFGSPTTFVNKLGNAKEADLAQKASNLDVSTLQNLKGKFPSVFEKAKQAKINDMVQSSTNAASGFNDVRFIKQYDGLDKEMKNLIFTPEMQTHIESLKTLKQAIPAKLGASGTPEGMMTMDMFNPKRNALDFGIKKVLDSTGRPEIPAGMATTASGKVIPLSSKLQTAQALRGSEIRPSLTVLPNAADKDTPTKGPDKWANDGIQKLIDHDTSLSPDVLNKLKDSKKGKDLLIKASDLKPGSKAMENLSTQIRSSYLNGDK